MTMSNLDFALDEYHGRVRAVRDVMRQREVDFLIVDQPEHLVYLFGYLPTAARYQACILPLNDVPHMIVRALDVVTFADQSWLDSYTKFSDDTDSLELLIREIAVRAKPGIRLGVETDSNLMTVQRYSQIQASLPDVQIVDFSRAMWEMRLIKSAAEVAYLRQAAKIADLSLDRAINAAREGVSERVPAAAGYSAAIELGADNGRVLLIACGRLSDAIHGRLGDHILSSGDILHLELVPQVRGYSSRVMRPTVIGPPDKERQRTVQRLIDIQDQQLAAMIPGASAADVDRIARQQVLDEGLTTVYPQVTGYTLGYHAQPRTTDHTRIFTPNADWVLRAGMVFHMYLGARGMAVSETILVGADGPERLTTTERRLFIR